MYQKTLLSCLDSFYLLLRRLDAAAASADSLRSVGELQQVSGAVRSALGDLQQVIASDVDLDEDDSFEAYCNRRMVSDAGFNYGPP